MRGSKEWKWVVSALAGPDETRRWLWFVHVMHGMVYASNGRVLHAVKNHLGLDDGLYNLAGNLVMGAPHPLYKKTFGARHETLAYVNVSELRPKPVRDYWCYEFKGRHVRGTGAHVQTRLIDDMLTHTRATWFAAGFAEPTASVLL